MKTYDSFTNAYYDLLHEVHNNPEFTVSPRGMKIKENIGVSFRLTDPKNRIPQIKERGYNSSYFAAETLWYLAGLDSTAWIANYSKFWNDISDDGLTANSAYGARMFKPHPRIASGINPDWTQWQFIIDELRADQDSRRAVIHIRTAQDSLLAKKDVPCTLTMQFFLREDKLYLIVSMRSNDAVLGLANDVPAFTIFQELMALDLSEALGKPIGLGDYIHQANSLHIYERHFSMVESILDNTTNFAYTSAALAEPMPSMPHRPPLDKLLSFEEQCQKATTAGELEIAVSNLTISDYYRDWCVLLALHRVKKLAYEIDQSKRFTSMLTYRGYDYSQR